jgi:hypothetical protein
MDIRIATSYFETEVRSPSVSPLGIASRIAFPCESLINYFL